MKKQLILILSILVVIGRELDWHCIIKRIMKECVMTSKDGVKLSEVKELIMKDEEFKTDIENTTSCYTIPL